MSSDLSQDAAWVSVEIPYPVEWTQNLLKEIERLFRINSLLEIKVWKYLAPNLVQFEALNLSNGQRLSTELRLEALADGWRIHFKDGLKTSTCLQATPRDDNNSLLTVTDDYSGTPEAERKHRIDEVDRSLLQWGQDLHHYLHAWKRWSWLPLWRWYMCKIWHGMKPSARRITRWILWITGAEIVAFLFVLTIFVIEQ